MRQLVEILRDQGFIHFNFSPPRWAWDFDKVANLEISDNVLVLLIEEMQKLPTDLQLGLKVASCLGSSVKYSILDILSQDLMVNLRHLLDQVVEQGFMVMLMKQGCVSPTTRYNRQPTK